MQLLATHPSWAAHSLNPQHHKVARHTSAYLSALGRSKREPCQYVKLSSGSYIAAFLRCDGKFEPPSLCGLQSVEPFISCLFTSNQSIERERLIELSNHDATNTLPQPLAHHPRPPNHQPRKWHPRQRQHLDHNPRIRSKRYSPLHRSLRGTNSPPINRHSRHSTHSGHHHLPYHDQHDSLMENAGKQVQRCSTFGRHG